LVAHINSDTWMLPTPYVKIRGESHMFEIHSDMNRVMDVIEACLRPLAVPTGIPEILSKNEIFSQKSALLKPGVHQGVLCVRLNNESGEFKFPVSSVRLDYPADPRLATSLLVKLGPQSEEIAFGKEEIVSLALMTIADTGAGMVSEVLPQKPLPGKNSFGGIDFRALPIVTQAVSNLRAPINATNMGVLQRMNLSEEWGQIEQMVSGGIIPSSERIKEFLQASCAQGSAERDVEKVISCISDILRQEEESCCLTDNTLRDILVVLEATPQGSELSKIFL